MLLIVDDDMAIRTSLSLLFKKEGYDVTGVASPSEALQWLSANTPQLIILDLNFSIETSGEEGLKLLQEIRDRYSAVPVILLTGWGTIELAVKGMKIGARDFITKPWQNDHLLKSARTLLNLNAAPPESLSRRQLDNQYHFHQIIGEDPKLLEILRTVARIAPTEASVLITGESGTGKELIAEAIHRNSKRKGKPFVKVNLGGIASTLLESELFGYTRGAFTDARTDRAGRFEMADKGTVFLDEIGELSLADQVKLLRVLQERTFEPLGSSKTRTVDIRVICATNRNLEEMVAAGTFREDLYYRINLITIQLPALRERTEDIPLLANAFVYNLREIYGRPDMQISKSAARWLRTLPLPGNIRQLKNLVERSVLLAGGDLLEMEDISKHLPEQTHPRTVNASLPEMTLEEMEYQMIVRAMEFHRNRLSKVAESLGITRFSLYRRLEKYGITYDADNL